MTLSGIVISSDLTANLHISQPAVCRGSYPSVGSHVGYIPAPNTHRKDILVTVGEQGEQLVSVESVESPGPAPTLLHYG